MALIPGTRLGAYEVLSLVGSGGMGEVYRGRDTKLGREVAIKILPEAVARDPERIARFEREAKMLAALNHPGIAQIHGFEESTGTPALIMELVEGPTLADRVAKGPLPLDEALAIAKQIAEALEAAHDQGIIHRDLKPANIKVRDDGTVKILDFGLAKALEPVASVASGGSGSNRLTQSPTLTTPAMMTGVGVILGTAAYMSPEQAKGRAPDKRSDIWAFGCVLYEMLTGQPAFNGDDVADTLANVIKSEPDWGALPKLSGAVGLLLTRCLEKDWSRRIRDVATIAFLLEDRREPVPSTSRRRWPRLAVAMTVVVALLIGAASGIVWRTKTRSAEADPVTRFQVALPSGGSLFVSTNAARAVALSPDGTRVVYAVRFGSGHAQLYSRRLAELDAVPISGTEFGYNPFFSPDGRWIAFTASTTNKLMKVPVEGGTPVEICDMPGSRGAVWLPDDTIVLSSAPSLAGLKRVPSSGGAIADVTVLDGKVETSHAWPEVLPDGRTILFTIGRESSRSIAAVNIDTHKQVTILNDAFAPHYVSSGHLIFSARDGSVKAVSFDVRTLQVRDEPVPVIQDAGSYLQTGLLQLATSQTGTVAYVSGESQIRSLVWVDRNGAIQPTNAPRRIFEFPRISPDGQRVAMSIVTPSSGALRDVWILDVPRGTLSRVTAEVEEAESPAWSQDGRHLTYMAQRVGKRHVMRTLADGSGTAEELVETDRHLHSGSWSPAGDQFVAEVANGVDAGSIWRLQLTPKTVLTPYLPRGRARFQSPVLSPDGRWMAYVSDETNQPEVYIQAFPGPGARYQVSTNGGMEPRFARSGSELFYREGDKVIGVSIAPHETGLRMGAPKTLFAGPFDIAPGANPTTWYDVGPDGRFLMIQSAAERTANLIVIVQHWDRELATRTSK